MIMHNFIFTIAQTAGENRSPILPPLYDVVWSVIILIPIVVAIMYLAVPKFNSITAERAARIQEGLDLTEKAKHDSAGAQKAVAELIAAAREDAGKIRDEASAQAGDIVARAQAKANEEAARILDNANRQIEAERQAAQLSLRTDVGILAVELAEKIVGEQLRDRDLSARVVDRFLDDLEENTTAPALEN